MGYDVPADRFAAVCSGKERARAGVRLDLIRHEDREVEFLEKEEE